MRLLMVEDDKQLREAVVFQLKADGYEIDACESGEDAEYYMNFHYDAILLDRMLPGMDGLEVLRRIRKRGISTPVILVTALGDLEERIQGLDSGADDYLTKPYAVDELKARLRALFRRPFQTISGDKLQVGDTILWNNEWKLGCKGKKTTLSKKENALLEYFFMNPDQILEREKILYRVWGADKFVEEGNVDTYIHFIRRRLVSVESDVQIKSVHGIGYRLIKKDESELI